MTRKAVIFDLDGTLLDTLQDIADSANFALSCFGYPQHDVSAFRYFVGDGVEMLATRSLPENARDKKTIEKLTDCINEAYSKRWANKTRPFPGITELLNTLTARGIALAVLTNKRQEFAEATVLKLLPDWHFEVIIGARPSLPKKPNPEAALLLAGQMKLAPADFLYLGDSGVDMKTAVAAGMYPVGALWGFRTADELMDGGAKALVKTPADVLPLLDN